jgi:hypothetical protein
VLKVFYASLYPLSFKLIFALLLNRNIAQNEA